MCYDVCRGGNSLKDNVVLIGMPAAGKTTIGKLLASKMGYRFVDSDRLIEEDQGKTLEEIMREAGREEFMQIESRVNASLDLHHCVIAPGGSVVYEPEAMAHLKDIAEVVYLEVAFSDLERRVGNLAARGVAIREDQTFKDLYEERCPLYAEAADITIVNLTSPDQVAERILDSLMSGMEESISGEEAP